MDLGRKRLKYQLPIKVFQVCWCQKLLKMDAAAERTPGMSASLSCFSHSKLWFVTQGRKQNLYRNQSYLSSKTVGLWGPTLGSNWARGCVGRNASRANGMRGMAQRISTTFSCNVQFFSKVDCQAWPTPAPSAPWASFVAGASRKAGRASLPQDKQKLRLSSLLVSRHCRRETRQFKTSKGTKKSRLASWAHAAAC